MSETIVRKAYYRDQAGNEKTADKVRFAVGRVGVGLGSAVWSAMNSHSRSANDLFMQTSGMAADVKITFHQRDAVVGYRSESFDSLKQRGVIPSDAKRQVESVPITDEAVIAARIVFHPRMLRRPDIALPIPDKKITIINPPPDDHALIVFALHSWGEPFSLEDPKTGQNLPWFARLQSGHRHLTFTHCAVPVDFDAIASKIKALVANLPEFPHLAGFGRDSPLSVVTWGVEKTFLNFTEVHNVYPNPDRQPSDLR